MKQQLTRLPKYILGFFSWLINSFKLFWSSGRWQKIVIVIVSLIILSLGGLYGASRWYAHSVASQPLQLGVTFVAPYAKSLGLDPGKTYQAILDDLQIKNLRLVSYWNQIEQQPGVYYFADLDRQFALAEQANAKISLALGLRQPRWPECHAPDWANVQGDSTDWHIALDNFISAVVNRYKDSPALKSYQLENEYFLEAFGECPVPTTERLQTEFDLVKQIDPVTPIIMSRSNNFPSLVLSQPQPDIVGTSVYRRVWNDSIYKGYFNYPLPAWYYGGIAGLQKIFTGHDTVLHEMQMEPWPPHGQFVANVSQAVQDESFKSSDFASRVQFAKDTGLRSIDFWGAEWWYYRKVKLNDPAFWDQAKQVFNNL